MTVSVTPDVRWKRWSRRALLVISCLCLVLAVVTLWLRIQIGNTDRFARTIDPIATDAAIQEAAIVALTDRFSARLSEAQTRETLVDRQQYLAAPINALLTDYVEQIVRSVITSDEYQQFWVAAKQAIHPRLSALLTGSNTENMTTAEGKVTLDLSPLVEAVQTRLAERGLDVLAAVPVAPEDVTIVLVDSPDLAKVQDIVDVLYRLAALFPILVLLTLGGYLWLTPNRRSGDHPCRARRGDDNGVVPGAALGGTLAVPGRGEFRRQSQCGRGLLRHYRQILPGGRPSHRPHRARGCRGGLCHPAGRVGRADECRRQAAVGRYWRNRSNLGRPEPRAPAGLPPGGLLSLHHHAQSRFAGLVASDSDARARRDRADPSDIALRGAP